MSEFYIECPSCGKYAQAQTGFFARKRIDCTCGYTIHVRTDKMATRQCPHCGNTVVYDQSKGNQAVCPVCKELIDTATERGGTAEFACSQCGVWLHAQRDAVTCTCPVCSYENDVAERILKERIRQEGLASVIKYEGDNDTLVWKHPLEDFNWGSQLIVHESQEAVFIRDGKALDLFGAGRYTLDTQQYHFLEQDCQMPDGGEVAFHSEVYFINLAVQMGVKWGTDSKVRLFDPVSGLHVELGACGEFSIRVEDSRRLLLKIVGSAAGLNQEQLFGAGQEKSFFRTMVMTQVKSFLARTIKEQSINVLEIDEHLLTLSDALRKKLNEALAEYGLMIPEFYVSRVITPDDDPDFARMKAQYAQQYLLVKQEEILRKEAEAAAQRKFVEARTAAQMKIIGAQGEAEALKVQKAAEAEAYRMQAEAEAQEMGMKGFTYQQETVRQVGMEAMKNGIGGGSTGVLGEIAGIGVSMGALGGVMDMTKEALNPVIKQTGAVEQDVNGKDSDQWSCSCGKKGISSKFCPDCGAKRPLQDSPAPQHSWDCEACGQKGINSKFCPNCGNRRGE